MRRLHLFPKKSQNPSNSTDNKIIKVNEIGYRVFQESDRVHCPINLKSNTPVILEYDQDRKTVPSDFTSDRNILFLNPLTY